MPSVLATPLDLINEMSYYAPRHESVQVSLKDLQNTRHYSTESNIRKSIQYQ